MVHNITLKDFKKLTDVDRKKLKKDVLIDILLATNDEGIEISELSLAIKELTNLVSGYKTEVEENSREIVGMKVNLELIKNDNATLKKDCNNMSARLNNLEQRSRNKNLEVIGLREPNELETDTTLTLKFLNNEMKAEVNTDDIDVCHQVPSKRTDGKRIIIVAMKHRKKRDDILKCKQNLRIYNEHLDPSHRVYVNEQLSPENKKLFANCAKKKFQLGFKFLWTKNGVCFLKKDELSHRYFRITNEDELSKIT